MDIDESFQVYKDQEYKLGYNIKLDDDELSSQRRVISKIIKFDKNNQYGFVMTKPMPVGAIKEKDPSWTEYKILFEKVSLDDKKDHIFIVDIEFDYEHATDRKIMYNEIIPSFIEKDTKIEANKRSVYQLLELYSEDKNGNPHKYKVSAKAHANMLSKKFIPLYLEEIKFAVLRCGWKVTNLYKHYYFDQERCKKNFILMNQKARQEATDKVESDFCKLLNNDTSHEFFDKFSCRDESTKKKVGLYEVDNANLVTIAVNPKEYMEIFKNKDLNKKHKGIKKTTAGMNFESFASRIMGIREYTIS